MTDLNVEYKKKFNRTDAGILSKCHFQVTLMIGLNNGFSTIFLLRPINFHESRNLSRLGLNFIPYACIPLLFHLSSQNPFPAFFCNALSSFFFIPRFVRKRERNRKSYYFSVDLCKRRREQRREQPLFYPFYVRFYVKSSIIHATMNLPNGITILALKRIIVDLLFQYILSITLWKRYSWIKAHEQRPDVDNRIGLMQVSSYKEYTCFTIMNVYTTIKSNFSFFFIRI